MKFGLGFPVIKLYPPTVQPWEESATSADVVRIAQTAEEVGFDYLGVSDHIFMTVEMAKLMGGRWCEGVTAITFLAGATKRIQVYNSVLVLPYRDPVILAKQMATLDFLSGGRSILGIGIGHLEKEFEVLKVPRAERGPMSDEYLEAIKILWTEERPEFHGKYVEFDDIVFEPRPVAKPHPPIWIGGNTKPAMRRAAKYGDGWVPWQITPAQLPEALDYLKSRPSSPSGPAPSTSSCRRSSSSGRRGRSGSSARRASPTRRRSGSKPSARTATPAPPPPASPSATPRPSTTSSRSCTGSRRRLSRRRGGRGSSYI